MEVQQDKNTDSVTSKGTLYNKKRDYTGKTFHQVMSHKNPHQTTTQNHTTQKTYS